MIRHVIEHLGFKDEWILTVNHVLSFIPGVPVFFVISGFLVYRSYHRNSGNLTQYFINRAVRIFPALLPAACLGIIAILWFYPFPIKQLLSGEVFLWFIGQITFFQFYTPEIIRFFGVGTPNGSLWTIPVELQFYVLLPLIGYYLRKLRNKNLLLALIILLSIVANSMLKSVYFDDQLLGKLIGVSFIPYIYFFLIGVFISMNWSMLEKGFRGKGIVWLSFFLVSVFILNYFSIPFTSYWYFSFFKVIYDLSLAGLVISVAYSQLGLKPVKFDISYGIYIYHMIFINIVIHMGYTNNIYNLLIVFLMTFTAASMSWDFIERPALQLKKSITTFYN